MLLWHDLAKSSLLAYTETRRFEEGWTRWWEREGEVLQQRVPPPLRDGDRSVIREPLTHTSHPTTRWEAAVLSCFDATFALYLRRLSTIWISLQKTREDRGGQSPPCAWEPSPGAPQHPSWWLMVTRWPRSPAQLVLGTRLERSEQPDMGWLHNRVTASQACAGFYSKTRR